jgi:mycothiol synthase
MNINVRAVLRTWMTRQGLVRAGPGPGRRVRDLTTRPYEPGDAAAITVLMNTIAEAGGGRAGSTVEGTGALLSSRVANFHSDSRLTFTPDGTMVAAGLVATPPPGGLRVELFGGVHPGWRGRGIGRALLGWQCQRAGQIQRVTAPGIRWHAAIRVSAGEPTARRLLARLGFTPVRYFCEMLASTCAPGNATLPPGLRSLPPEAEAGHGRPLYEAYMEAFAGNWGHQRREFDRWLSTTLRSEDFRPDLSRLAYDGDEIAAFILSYRDNDPDRIHVGEVGTRLPWRGKGVAGALLAEVIRACARAGYPYVCLVVDTDNPTGAMGVYERAGFRREHVLAAHWRPIG